MVIKQHETTNMINELLFYAKCHTTRNVRASSQKIWANRTRSADGPHAPVSNSA